MRHTTRLAAWLPMLLAGAGQAWAQDVELYDQPDFKGTRLTLSATTADLAAFGMGGRVASVVVKRGYWEFCTQPQFGGACVAVGAGRYAQLPPALRGNVNSLRPATQTTGAPPPPPSVRPPAAVVLWAGEFNGNQLLVNEAVQDLARRAFNDSAESVEIFSGSWELCTDGGYAGNCIRLSPGRHVLPPSHRAALSSLRPVPGTAPPVAPGTGGGGSQAAAVLYEHHGFSGATWPLTGAAAQLGKFNDRTSSVEVFRGRWQFCEHAEFRGHCVVVGPGRHEAPPEWNDVISSARPVFGTNDQPLPAHGGVTLHEHADFSGRSLLRSEATPELKPHGFNDRASAIEVHGGNWELCSDGGYGGRCLVFGPGRHVLPPELADKASSLRPR